MNTNIHIHNLAYSAQLMKMKDGLLMSLVGEGDHVNSAAKCAFNPMHLKGVWHNELESEMRIYDVTYNGSISGVYCSAVGKATYYYDLVGRYDPEPNCSPGYTGTTVGWTVSYRNDQLNAHSTTTWSGQLQTNGREKTILTKWLLTTQTASKDNWASTKIGSDTFMPGPSPSKKCQW